MPKAVKTRKDPLFEFVVVFAIMLGGVFSFSSDTQQVEAKPEVKPPVVEVVEV
jgi:multidrug efflux pump subunit AcrB